MEILTKDECHVNFEDIKMKIEDGAIFIHPTDTIYGIGCDATQKNAVRKIRDIKNRHESPFSVIAPSKNWILKNCEITNSVKEWLDKLPGPYTIILKLKNKKCIAPNVNFDLETLGIRFPNHWFSQYVERLGRPIVTTSANKSGDNFMTCLENLNPEVRDFIDFIIYEDEKHGRPSTIIDLTYNGAIVKHR